MIQNELEEKLFHGLTRQEVIDRIIDFEIEHDIMPDWREVLEYGFGGYQYVDDEVLNELYVQYFVDEEYEVDPDVLPPDFVPMDGHGNTIGDMQ